MYHHNEDHHTNTHQLLNPKWKQHPHFPTTSSSQHPCKPTAGLGALDLFRCLGSTALAARLHLWGPYVLGVLSHNSGNAAVGTIENAGETGRNIDFGNTEGVGCKRVKCQNILIDTSGESCIEKDGIYWLPVQYCRLRKLGWKSRRQRQWRWLGLWGYELRPELGRHRRRWREGQLLQWRRSSCFLKLGEMGFFERGFFLGLYVWEGLVVFRNVQMLEAWYWWWDVVCWG